MHELQSKISSLENTIAVLVQQRSTTTPPGGLDISQNVCYIPVYICMHAQSPWWTLESSDALTFPATY